MIAFKLSGRLKLIVAIPWEIDTESVLMTERADLGSTGRSCPVLVVLAQYRSLLVAGTNVGTGPQARMDIPHGVCMQDVTVVTGSHRNSQVDH